jgi:hypothetical protein
MQKRIYFRVRLSEEERERLMQLAKAWGCSRSEILRSGLKLFYSHEPKERDIKSIEPAPRKGVLDQGAKPSSQPGGPETAKKSL